LQSNYRIFFSNTEIIVGEDEKGMKSFKTICKAS